MNNLVIETEVSYIFYDIINKGLRLNIIKISSVVYTIS